MPRGHGVRFPPTPRAVITNSFPTGVPQEFTDNFPNKQFGFTWQFAYRINPHKKIIEIKPHALTGSFTLKTGNKVKTNTTGWQPYEGIGVPFKLSLGKKVSLLQKDEFIAELFTAGENLLAISNLKRHFFYKFTAKKNPKEWSLNFGQPIPGKITNLCNKIDHTLSLSVGNLSDQRNSAVMHPNDRTDYAEDHLGQRHQFGYTLTYCVLTSDCTVQFVDTGLESDISRGITTPRGVNRNGEVYLMQGETISAAGSTIFICVRDYNNTRRFYTINHDYDLCGGIPGMQSVISCEQANDSETIQPVVGEQYGPDGEVILSTGIRHLPFGLPGKTGWQEVDITGIENPEKLTSNISIHVTGPGNASREIRIISKNTDGSTTGYWAKNIYDSNWHFVQATFELSGIPTTEVVRNFDPSLPAGLKNYSILLDEDDSPNFFIELLNFHPFNTPGEPSILRVTHHTPLGDKYAYINLYTIDCWNLDLFPQGGNLRGVSEGMMKALRGTLFIQRSAGDILLDPDLSSYVYKNFLQCHGNRNMNSINVYADNTRVILELGKSKLSIDFTRTLSSAEYDHSFYMRVANDPRLAINNPGSLSLQDFYNLRSINSQALEFIRKIHHDNNKRNWEFLGIDTIAARGAPVVGTIFKAAKHALSSKIYFPTSFVQNAITDGGQELHAQSRVNMEAIRKRRAIGNPSFEEAVIILELRLIEIDRHIQGFILRKPPTTLQYCPHPPGRACRPTPSGNTSFQPR